MDHDPQNAADDLIARLTDALRLRGDTPDDFRRVVEGFFSQLQLLPRRELEAHLTALAQMENTVAELERRINELEKA